MCIWVPQGAPMTTRNGAEGPSASICYASLKCSQVEFQICILGKDLCRPQNEPETSRTKDAGEWAISTNATAPSLSLIWEICTVGHPSGSPETFQNLGAIYPPVRARTKPSESTECCGGAELPALGARITPTEC